MCLLWGNSMIFVVTFSSVVFAIPLKTTSLNPMIQMADKTSEDLIRFRAQRVQDQAFDLSFAFQQLQNIDAPISAERFLQVMGPGLKSLGISSLSFDPALTQREKDLLHALIFSLTLEAKAEELQISRKERSLAIRGILQFTADWLITKAEEKKSKGEEIQWHEIAQDFARTMEGVLPEPLRNFFEDHLRAKSSKLLSLLRKLQKSTESELLRLDNQFNQGEKESQLNTSIYNQKQRWRSGLSAAGWGLGSLTTALGPPLLIHSSPSLILASVVASTIISKPLFSWVHKFKDYGATQKQREEKLTQQQIRVMSQIDQAQVRLLVHKILQELLDPQFNEPMDSLKTEDEMDSKNSSLDEPEPIPFEVTAAVRSYLGDITDIDIFRGTDGKEQNLYLISNKRNLLVSVFYPFRQKKLGSKPEFIHYPNGSFTVFDGRSVTLRSGKVIEVNGETHSRLAPLNEKHIVWTGFLSGWHDNHLVLEKKSVDEIQVQGKISGWSGIHLTLKKRDDKVMLEGRIRGSKVSLEMVRKQDHIAAVTGKIFGKKEIQFLIKTLGPGLYRIYGGVMGSADNELIVEQLSATEIRVTGSVMGYQGVDILMNGSLIGSVDSDVEQMTYVLTPLSIFFLKN